jgi:hypothetical protein
MAVGNLGIKLISRPESHETAMELNTQEQQYVW